MARMYPRFLYADPKDTKSKGPFIVHLMDPRVVICIRKEGEDCSGLNGLGFNFEDLKMDFFLLDEFDEKDRFKYEKVLEDAIKWFDGQVTLGNITL